MKHKNKTISEMDSEEYNDYVHDKLLKGMQFYRSPVGTMIAIGDLYGDIFLSRDGEVFYQLCVKGSSGSETHGVRTLENPHGEFVRTHKLYNDESTYFVITQPGKVKTDPKFVDLVGESHTESEKWSMFIPIQNLNRRPLRFHALPKTRHAEYLLKMPDKKVIYVDVPLYNWAYENFRVFMTNDKGGFQWIPLSKKDGLPVNRYRDGGTTFIKTEKGELFVPCAEGYNGKTTPTFTDTDGKESELVDLTQYAGDSITYKENYFPSVLLLAASQ